MRDLEYLRVTVAWLLNQNTMKFSERLIYVDAEWHKDGLPNLHGKWCGFSFSLVKDRFRVATEIARGSVSRHKHIDHVRPTTNLAKNRHNVWLKKRTAHTSVTLLP